MDQASRIMARWVGVSDIIDRERIACAAWKRAVGKRVASRTRAMKLVRTTLVVEVDDELWRKNLWSLRYQILANLEKVLGPEMVKDVELRVMPPRVGPKREQAVAAIDTVIDEAEAIADPGLRRIYKAARVREIA
jgi:hypothetical protein